MKTKLYTLSKMSTDGDDDIVFIDYNKNLEVSLVLAQEMVDNRLEFTNNKPHYVIIDATGIKSMSLDAKNYLLDPDYGTKNILGSAIIANNPVSAMIANIFTKGAKNFPSRFFSKKADAIKWIKDLKV